MNKKIIPSFALAAALLLPSLSNAGIFGKDEWEKDDCPKKHSLAWCLADYQGRSKGMHDLSKEAFADKLRKAGITDESKIYQIMDTGIGVAGSAAAFSVLGALGGGVFFLQNFMPSPEEQNRGNPYIVFIDDGDMNRTDSQVLEDFRNNLDIAIKKSYSIFPKDINVVEIEKGVLKIESTKEGCKDKSDCTIFYKNADAFVKLDKTESPPSYLSNKPVRSAKKGLNAGIAFHKIPKEINHTELVKIISSNLPSAYYWYIPAGYIGNPFPMFLNRGNALFFIKPSPNDQVPVLPHVAAKNKEAGKPGSEPAPECPPTNDLAQPAAASPGDIAANKANSVAANDPQTPNSNPSSGAEMR